jgi:hypothetical protein
MAGLIGAAFMRNPSPCYSEQNRVISEKNSEMIARNARMCRNQSIFEFSGKFENREKQGGTLPKQESRLR